MLLLADAVKAKRRRRKDKEKLEFIKALKEQEEEEAHLQELRRARLSHGHYAFKTATNVEVYVFFRAEHLIFNYFLQLLIIIMVSVIA